ncbi:MAG: hypothetical protein QXL01_03680 [Thermoplasmatales archaeon]
MSLTVLRKCPISNCRHNHKLVYADKSQIKNHILRDHDYHEKLEAAHDYGLIQDLSQRRSPDWLAESLTDFSLVGNDDQ